jgi:hypothetical protein
MYMYRVVVLNPGLFPVVQVTDVVVAADTGQLIPSKIIVYLEMSLDKPIPEKVTSVPPVTVPYLGLTAVRAPVKDPEYSIELRLVT